MSLRPGKGSKPPQDGSTTSGPPHSGSSAGGGGGYYGAALHGSSSNNSPSHGMDASTSSRHSVGSTGGSSGGGYYASSPYRAAHNPAILGSNYSSKLPPSPYAAGPPPPPPSPYAPSSGGSSKPTYSAAGGGPYSPVGRAARPPAPMPPPISPSPYQSYGGGGGGGMGAAAAPATSGNNINRNNHHNAYANEGYKDKPLRKKKKNAFLAVLGFLVRHWALVLALAFLGTTLRCSVQQKSLLRQIRGARTLDEAAALYRSLQADADRLRRELRAAQESHRAERGKTAAAENRQRALQQELDALKAELEGPGAAAGLKKMEQREEAWMQQVQLLQQATTRESRRAATEKFGPGPHYVQISVTLPHLKGSAKYKSFVVEMAPLESMPHAVHLFLEQVSHQLWNRAWFYVNGPHVLQCGPQANEDELLDDATDERSVALRPFRELQLDALAFPEYSEDFPHVRWTLGYTGRPGGPDFYINKVDNTAAHGPGGQFHHELDEFADPCFARVASGFDVIKAMARAPTVLDAESEYAYFLEEPIYVTKMEIVTDPQNPKPKKISTQRTKVKAAVKGGEDDDEEGDEVDGVEDGDETDDETEEENASISDEQMNILTDQFLEAMHSEAGIEFLEKMYTERNDSSPYETIGKGPARMFEALSKSASEEERAKLVEALSKSASETARSRRKHRKGRKVEAEKDAEESVIEDDGSEEADTVDVEKQQSRWKVSRKTGSDETDSNAAPAKDDSATKKDKQFAIDAAARRKERRARAKKTNKSDEDDKDKDVKEDGTKAKKPATQRAVTMDDEQDLPPDKADKPDKEKEIESRRAESTEQASQRRANKRKPKRYKPKIEHSVEP